MGSVLSCGDRFKSEKVVDQLQQAGQGGFKKE